MGIADDAADPKPSTRSYVTGIEANAVAEVRRSVREDCGIMHVFDFRVVEGVAR